MNVRRSAFPHDPAVKRVPDILRTLAVATIGFAVSACATRPAPYMGSPTRGQMITHFDLALEARDFAIHGDVQSFRHSADELAELDPARDLPAEIILQLGPMRWEAREGALARDPEEAAVAAARIAQTCGDCHAANDVALGDRFTLGGPPPGDTPARHMEGLAWASRLLWDGLIGPSDRTWYAGAEALVELGVLPAGLPADVSAEDVQEAGARLQQLGRRATLLRDTDERVEVLGEIWGTCAGCHTAGH